MNIISRTMKIEQKAWRELHTHAAAQISHGFADRVMRSAYGPRPHVWRQLYAVAEPKLRPGFAERVLRAARVAVELPSLSSQFALSAVTAAACLGAVLFINSRSLDQADARNLAEWQQLVSAADEMDSFDL